MDDRSDEQTLEELLESFRFMQKGKVYEMPNWAIE